jgi:Putative transposase
LVRLVGSTSYLGRYTHRVGIANSRLVLVRQDAVIFRTKNDQTLSLTPVEFLRRFVQHVLPDGFHKIRHYGLYAGASDDARKRAFERLAPSTSAATTTKAAPSWSDELLELTGHDVQRCPRCGDALEHHPVVAMLARAPPLAREAAA